ncbi:MAG: RIO1 family regulatory kinase/ATPase [Candidatus Caldarchaeum sp.]
MSEFHSPVLFAAVERLSGDYDLSMLAYPSKDPHEIKARISSMKQLGISSLGVREVGGRYEPFVLGKGVRGVVVLGLMNYQKVAVKLLRTDSPVKSMQKEAVMHYRANSMHVGPKIIQWTDDMIVMEYVEGIKLGELFTKEHPASLSTSIEQVLEQCHTMDVNALDHGQLTNSSDHVIVDRTLKPYIIDFSHSSTARKPSNVTSFVSYITRVLKRYDNTYLIECLKDYKKGFPKTEFEKVKQTVLSMLR